MKQVSVGLIGAGRIGRIHTGNLLQMRNVSIAAVTDPFLNQDWAASLGLRSVPAEADIFGDPGIDAVVISSPSDLHASQIIAAAQAGKHIFCEKPVALDPELILKALAAVKKSGVKLQVGFNRRFDPSFRRLREAYVNGSVGTLVNISIISRDPEPPPAEYVKVSGGIFLDMTIHDFDMVRYLSGCEVSEVYARGAVRVDERIGEAGDLDTAITTLTLENGALAVIENCRKAVYGYDQRIEVFGTKGSIQAGNRTDTSAVLTTEEGSVSDRPMNFFLERYRESYVHEMSEFIDALANDKPVPVDGQAGLEAVYTGLAAKLSVERQTPVSLSEIRL